MAVSLQIDLNEKLYIRDPQKTQLGRRIIQYGIILFDELGFEDFTFRKLADRIGSTEASVYRYFENKHLLLVYLVSWYWEWMRFQVEMNTLNIDDPKRSLEIAIQTIVATARRNASIEFVDEDILHRIVVAEATKAYHTKAVDEDNRNGFFLSYKALSKRIATIISEVRPDFPYPHALASNLLEMANNHMYFALHLPSLTEVKAKENIAEQVVELLKYFSFNLLGVLDSDQ
jgi:AcrR family transcriptional regulator